MRTLTPEIEIVLLLYLSIPCNETHILSVLGHERARGYKLYVPSFLMGCMLCMRYRYMSQFGRVNDISKLKVIVIV